MGKNKLSKFADMDRYKHVLQYPYAILQEKGFELRGKWNEIFFQNNNPLILELGCGKGEYTVELAKLYPDCNFIGIDIKGSRMWTGAKQVEDEGLTNVAFLRTHIELLESFFAEGEVAEIWITFPDPQMNKLNKRMTSVRFMTLYGHVLTDDGLIHLKTDSNFMYTYTNELVQLNHLPIVFQTTDLYNSGYADKILSIQTFYERQWLSRGLTIKYLKFKYKHISHWQEPAIDIEKDDYRSYGRSYTRDSRNFENS